MNVKSFSPELTADGSFTFFSSEFNEAFHSNYGAAGEAIGKFAIPCHLHKLARTKNQIKLLDICYGLGYNSAAAMETIWKINPQCRIELIALELDIQVPKSAIAHQLLDRWDKSIINYLTHLTNVCQIENGQLHAQLLLGDARETIQQIERSKFLADAIFLDPFSPPKCPQLWTIEFLKLVSKCLNPQGRLATYSCAASVRTALKLVGLQVGSSESVGRKSPGTIASFGCEDLPALSLQEREHLQTRAAIPYRDPQLQDSAATIRTRREKEQQLSQLEPTSHWKKRWFQTVDIS
jgi:tRNA U34 5-methylaminomethyl-2-thiouridine-forming methyltransferase MnmC